MTRLHEFSTQLLASTELQPLLENVLDAVIELQGADFGNVQLYMPKTQTLEIVAQRNFNRDFLDYFSRVHNGLAACGRALSQRRRIVIEDVQADPDFQPHRKIAASAGFRAVQSTPLFSRNGEPLGMISTHFHRPYRPSERDLRLTDLYTMQAAHIIESKRAEEEVRTSREQLRGLLRYLQSVREEERGRIARELHDEIGQALTGIKLSLETSMLQQGDVGRSKLGQTLALTNELIGRVRDLSLELRPAMLDDLGLVAALRWHFGRYTAQTKIEVDFKHAGLEERRFAAEIETAAYRIVQEGLTNVARHANVNRVKAEVCADEKLLRIRIHDLGAGFDLHSVSVGTTGGLSGMRERAEMLRGQF